jgi:putative membrane-bound dehydrogenase-like protein
MKSSHFVIPILAAASLSARAEPAADWKPSGDPHKVGMESLHLPADLEVTVWATSPDLFNPTNMDIDAAGRIWVAEGVNYRGKAKRRPGGDRIVVIQDTDGDGKADSSHTFVQDKELISPLGVAVFDNVVIVSQPPNLLKYTDVNRDQKFDPAVDTREVLLTGFNAINHDHSLHSVTAGPDGKWMFNNGNCGAMFTDKSGKTFRIGGPYFKSGGGDWPINNQEITGQTSDDGHVWTPGFTVRMNPDGTKAEIIGHGYRNSYEQTITSRGDVFQNDNDDPPACRTSFVLEYGNAGYFSRDGKRFYTTEKRPNQAHPRAHWRQDDPGTFDPGDVYGGGSPTGIAFYENGALGDKYVGTLFSCEPARNVIFSYQPQPKGATFALERTDFLTSNPDRQFSGADFAGGVKPLKSDAPAEENPIFFRPADVTVGPDGALYICDWFDARVGGHGTQDDATSGTIYRVAPKGFKPAIPKFDPTTVDGLITALRSPAVNVRFTGFQGLKALGDKALPAVNKLSNDPNPFVAARAVWLMPYLGKEGLSQVVARLKSDDPNTVITAYRALRRADIDVLPYAPALAASKDAAVRREVALSLRGQPATKTREIFLALAKAFDGTDKNEWEAIGLGAANQENEIWSYLREKMAPGSPAKWTPEFTRLTWRLWPSVAVDDLFARATDMSLTADERAFAVESIAFIQDRKAAEAMVKLAGPDSPTRALATRWLLQRGTGAWADFGLKEELKAKRIYDPEKIVVQPITVPAPDKAAKLPTLKEIAALKGDPKRGELAAARCIMCHAIGGKGVDYGPALKGWGKNQTPEVIARAILQPSADISQGFEGKVVKLKDGGEVHGLVSSERDPVIIQSTGGVTQMIPKDRVEKIEPFNRSLMLAPDQLGLSAQDIADLVEFLRSY